MIEGRSGKRGGHKLARVFRATQSVSMFLIYLVWGLIILGEEDRSCVYSPPFFFWESPICIAGTSSVGSRFGEWYTYL